jgi:hypothetical protein
VLKQKKTLDDKKKREYIEMAAKIAYYESIAELEYVGYEDSPDERRIKMKYSIGNAIMALLSDYKQSMAHLQQAKEVLQKGSLLLDDKYAVVLLVELLIRYDNNKLNSNDVAITSNEVRALKDIPAETRNEINMLLLRLKSNKRLTTKSADMKNRPSDFS